MWRILLHPFVLIILLIVGVLGYRWWQQSRFRHRVSQLPPGQKLSILFQLLRFLRIFFGRF
ncbi:MAG: hypothetical protein HY760_05130 [Nitrospirae bacterium]|nr:hypothetical protein [Nitrospirota bacterium]